MEEFRFQPIGFVRGGGHYPQEAPRQGVYACNTGRIELLEHRNFETALADLAGFDRIWVLFVFDRAGNWKPKVRPPDGADGRRIGLFATRAPHRPNPIGISAVELVGVEGRSVRIRNFDLLDGTPVLDIKPYIPDVDAFPASKAGWRDEIPPLLRSFTFEPEAEQAIRFLRTHGGPDLENALRSQLGARRPDPRRQRLTEVDPERKIRRLAFRTWRIDFEETEPPAPLRILSVTSGYPPAELAPGEPDPYHDKMLHRAFLAEHPRR